MAKFCRWCGSVLVSEREPLDGIVGLESMKRELQNIVETFSFLHSRQETKDIRLGVNTIIIGNTGTGKTTLSEVLRDYFYKNKIIEKPKLRIVDAVDYAHFVEKWDANIKDARNGILFFDNVQKLLPDSYSKSVNPLDKLFVEMNNWNDNPIVILAGLPTGLNEFLEANPAIRNRFKYIFYLPDYNHLELTQICKGILEQKYGIKQITPEANKKLEKYFKYEVKKKDESFGNGHLAKNVAEEIFTSYITHAAIDKRLCIEESDINLYVPPERSLNDILGELDEFIGMDEVKKAVHDIALEVKNNVEREKRGLETVKPSMHFVLTGNPGTGKTTIARKLGEIFESIGFLNSGHVVEVDRSQMVSQYVGETPKLVDKLCDKALGGILFIDEAYTLSPQNDAGTKDEQGRQALERLMKRMEDDRGKFVVIAAGYKTQMDSLLRINPGLKSRFNRFLNIDDYTPDELYDILHLFAKRRKLSFTQEADYVARLAVKQIYASRDKNFANAREIRTLFEHILSRQAERLSKNGLNAQSDETLQTIEASDIPYDKPEVVDYSVALNELNELIGLSSVKSEISNLAATLNLQIQKGENPNNSGKHYVFTGNPGTGKTTVARIMAKVLKSLGIIPQGQLIEVDRSNLVAGYAGQTAIKTNQVIDSALGGILFIDEAYTLNQSSNDTFGKEAIDTLLKRLEDDRGKFVCIIAGYTKEMNDFLATNPGLSSRFAAPIHFDDYSPDELLQIFMQISKQKNYIISDKVKKAVKNELQNRYLRRTKNFGNAREVRHLFNDAVSRQGKRLMEEVKAPDFDKSRMFEFAVSDINDGQTNIDKPLDTILSELDEFVGMKNVKEAIRRIAVQAVFMQERIDKGLGEVEASSMNFIITGNPGTGKTSIARKLGEVFKAVGLLPTSKIVEVDRGQMIGQYLGETPKIVNELCDRAMGGILFIDEAYTLISGGNDDRYGKEAIETLMKRMEDDKGKFVVIAAGYQKEMKSFLRCNPGLESRFTHNLHIDDYNESELKEIFKRLLKKKNYELAPTAEGALMERIICLSQNRSEHFANAREIHNLFNKTIQHLSLRVSMMPAENRTEKDYIMILPEDFEE
ncbi:MAG: AAA family ATPase [Bacteroidaceae bacterium]|nr:AAA family ATPase [Bacteroidaceae bacterium]